MALLYLFAFVVLINCIFFILFSRFSFSKPTEKISNNSFPISLIVCAKNEAENLKTHIPFWLKQQYPEFEIILINDASYDDTLEIMESFAINHANIKIVDVENNEAFWGSKKYALTLGIKKASHQRMVFTDADCKPSSNNWLLEIANHFSENKQLILGFGGYQKLAGLLNKMIRFETFMTAVQYFSYAKAGMPYMGVGRNLAYTNSLFFNNRGFMSHMDIPSGDDDLFVNEVATKENTTLCYTKDAFTISVPKKTWKEWSQQKRRHINTAKHYQLKHQIFLGLYYIFQLLFWGLSIVTLIVLDWKIPLAIIIFRFLFQWVVLSKAAKKLEQKDLMFWLPFLELFLILFQFSIFISNSSSKTTSWK